MSVHMIPFLVVLRQRFSDEHGGLEPLDNPDLYIEWLEELLYDQS